MRNLPVFVLSDLVSGGVEGVFGDPEDVCRAISRWYPDYSFSPHELIEIVEDGDVWEGRKTRGAHLLVTPLDMQ